MKMSVTFSVYIQIVTEKQPVNFQVVLSDNMGVIFRGSSIQSRDRLKNVK
jgi:hypothetical protein